MAAAEPRCPEGTGRGFRDSPRRPNAAPLIGERAARQRASQRKVAMSAAVWRRRHPFERQLSNPYLTPAANDATGMRARGR